MTDWIMIVITAVYVITTVFICIFNYRSAKATNEQLVALREQFNEEFRPILTIELQDRYQDEIIFKIKNIGIRSARNIYVEHKLPTYESDGDNRFIQGKTIKVLGNDRCLQPQNDITYSYKNDGLVGISLKLDAILMYESYNGNKFKEKVSVDVGELVMVY